MKYIKKIVFWVGMACVAVVVMVVLFLDIGLPLRYELPAGYKGWIVTQFDNPTCPSLKRDGLFLVIRVGENGGMCTSDHRDTKLRYRKYEYVDAGGNRTATQSPRGESIVDSEGYIDMDFIGSQDEIKQYPRPSNRHEALRAIERGGEEEKGVGGKKRGQATFLEIFVAVRAGAG